MPPAPRKVTIKKGTCRCTGMPKKGGGTGTRVVKIKTPKKPKVGIGTAKKVGSAKKAAPKKAPPKKATATKKGTGTSSGAKCKCSN